MSVQEDDDNTTSELVPTKLLLSTGLEFAIRWTARMTTIISVTLFVVLLWCILLHKRKLQRYKWFVLHHAVWCLVFHALGASVIPIFVPSISGGFSLGIGRSGTPFTSLVILEVTFGAGMSSGCALLVCLLYRYLITFPDGRADFASSYKYVLTAAAITICCVVTPALTLINDYDMSPGVVRQLARKADPEIAKIVAREASLIVVDYATAVRFAAVPFVTLVAAACVFTVVCFHSAKRLRELTKTTWKQGPPQRTTNFRVLLRYNLMQTCVTCLFIVLPAIVIIIAYFLSSRWAMTATNAVTVIVYLHCIAQYITTFYMIVPYRKTLLSILLRAKIIGQSSGGVSTITKPPQSIR